MRSRLRIRRILLLSSLLPIAVAAALLVGPSQAASEANPARCTVPGIMVVDDALGDALDMQPFHDIDHISVAEPNFGVGAAKLDLVLKVASLPAALPPDHSWPIQFIAPGGVFWAALTTFPPTGTSAIPAFVYGTGTVIDVLNPAGTLEPESDWNVNGTIQLVIPRSTIGAAIGQSVGSFLSRVRIEIAPGIAALTPDNAPQDLMGAGEYIVEGNCSPTAVTLASFDARAKLGRVAITWRTASENEIVGFNVWRGPLGEQKVNASLVPARGSVGGASYRLVDARVRRGGSYTYRLQIVKRDGSTAWYGSARVRAAR